MSFLISLTLAPGRDDDLIAEILSTPLGQVSIRVREMMRNGVSSGRFSQGQNVEVVSIDMHGADVEL